MEYSQSIHVTLSARKYHPPWLLFFMRAYTTLMQRIEIGAKWSIIVALTIMYGQLITITKQIELIVSTMKL